MTDLLSSGPLIEIHTLLCLHLQTVLLELRMMEVVVTTGATRYANLQSNCFPNKPTPNFMQPGCPFCCPTNRLKH